VLEEQFDFIGKTWKKTICLTKKMNDGLENLAELASVWVSELIRTCVARDLPKLKDLIRRRKIWR
jgi:hypothetical protein